jgi:hypothetical protein
MYTSDCRESAQNYDLVERRSKTEQRIKSSISFRSLLFGGRRETIRRHDDKSRFFFVDRYNQSHFIAIVLILFFSVVDAILTIVLTNHGANEINPIMAYCLEVGPYIFLSVKYSLTSVGLIILLILRNIFLKPIQNYAGSLFYYLLGAFIGVVSWQSLLLYRIIA